MSLLECLLYAITHLNISLLKKKMISFLRLGNSTGQLCDSIHGGSDDEGAEQRSLLSASPYRRGTGSVGRSR